MFKKINRILFERIIWHVLESEDRTFYTPSYSKEECWLRMNDFPEEPLWTLHFNGNTKDIEDTPVLWKINYPKKGVDKF